jgi:hypothetical protein
MYRILIVLIVCSQLIACKKNDNDKVLSINYDAKDASLISEGKFVSNAHTTSGSVKVYSKNGAKDLVFENFKTDSGPDLRVYVSKSTNNKDFIDVGTLKATSGNFYYTISSSVNTDDYKFVLIWCEDFSVLFGNAPL